MQVLPAFNDVEGTPRPLCHSSPALLHRRTSKPASAERHYKDIAVNIRQEPDISGLLGHATSSSMFTASKYLEPGPRSARRLTTCGFLPMPPISASPICTPTTSTSSRNLLPEEVSDTDEYITAPPTPSEVGSVISSNPPTWLSIPPTPPPKLFRRSVTSLAHRSQNPVIPSTSFPASSPNGEIGDNDEKPKRRASLPVMHSRERSSSESSAFYVKTRKSKDGTEAIVAASPLRTSFISSSNRTSKAAFPARRTAVFSISQEINSDLEDNDNGEGSWSNNGSTEASSSDQVHDSWHALKSKDDTRRYHALMELISTEVRYLMDLRVLVAIYLRQLPTITCRTPGSAFARNASFSSTSRSNSHTYLQTPANGSTATLNDLHGLQSITGLQPLTTITQEKKEKTPRYVFTNSEIDMLTRNAEEVLQLHEHLVEEMRAVMEPLGFPMDIDAGSEPSPPSSDAILNLEAGLCYIATKFATESSRFNAYEMFCAGHPEALEIVRKIQHQYGAEWDSFELRCSTLVHDLTGGDSTPSTEGFGSSLPPVTSSTEGSSASTGSVTSEKSPLRSSSVSSAERAIRPRFNAVGSFSTARDPNSSLRDKKRLTFMDYMITPVQRICRYPLLLDQMRPTKAVLELLPPPPPGHFNVNVIVHSAAQAMRHVASRVDEARHRHDVALQSSLIVSRICRGIPMAGSLPPGIASHGRPTLQHLTTSFLASLGVCLLAGSLDVMHHHGTRPNTSASIDAKYLGAFLYVGGYLILVKVTKGKTYEPKHWFRLSDFELSDSEEDAFLPCAFRLTCKEHQFEFAAACMREKDVWLSSIREAKLHTLTNWVNEPISSLNVDGKGELVPSTLDGPFETINSLPTIQSISEMKRNTDFPELTESLLEALATDPNPSKPRPSDIPSRRSSTASVKAVLHPMGSLETDTVVIRRSTASGRHIVDQGLRDVISAPCHNARSHASSREQDLFQAPSITRADPRTRTPPTLKMSRLKKHESVRVPRRKSTVESSDGGLQSLNEKATIRAKSLKVKKRPQKLSVTTDTDGECTFFLSPAERSGSPLTQSPTTTVSYPPSALSSPTRASIRDAPVPCSRLPAREIEHSRSTSRPNSLVNTFFRSRPSSPMRSTPSRSTPPPRTMLKKAPPRAASPNKSSGFALKRWMKGPFHRRTCSAPEEVPKQISDVSPTLPDIYFGDTLLLTESPAEIGR